MVITNETKKMNGNSSSSQNKEQQDDHNPSKKAKTSSLLTEVLGPDVYTPEREKILAQDYANSQPYHHSRILNLFQVDFLTKVKEQIKQNSKVNFKETDLFRVYQSIDLANLEPKSELAQNMPAVMQLREVLYSTEWRSFMERVTGLAPGTLSAQVDCACNCHAPGCHLLCHDDVIGTRKISYIMYLTEPDWKESEGGALELYDSHIPEGVKEAAASRREPNTVPSLNVMPVFNSMAFFIVEPGVSFHAVQEVLGDRPRLSIQGWYHAANVPEHMENATLSRLKEPLNEKAQEKNLVEKYIPWKDDRVQPLEQKRKQRAANADKLSDADRDYLALYVNETYLTKTAMEEIRQRFEEDSSAQLKHFFRTSWMEKVKVATTKQDEEARPEVGKEGYYEWGVSDDWKLIGPPHKQRYLQYQETQDYSVKQNTKQISADPLSIGQPTATASVGDLLSRLKQSVMQSPAFGRYLNYITSLGVPVGYKGQIRRFRPGLDYTVAHYGVLTQNAVLDATVCFAAGTGGVGPAPLEDQEQQQEDTTNDDSAANNKGEASGGAIVSNNTSDRLSNAGDEEEEEEDIDVDEADVLWQSDDVGGFECYIEADDYDGSFKDGDGNAGGDDDDGPEKEEEAAAAASVPEAADEYNADDDTNLLSVSASNNTLSLVYRDPGTMRFIKYVGSRAPSSRWDISMEYQVPEDHEDDADQKGKKQPA